MTKEHFGSQWPGNEPDSPPNSLDSAATGGDLFDDATFERLLRDLSALETVEFPEDVTEKILAIPGNSAVLKKNSTLPATVGSYEILDAFGSGGMGTVFRARHVVLDNEVALKLIRSDKPVSERSRDRFLREMRSLATVNHPNVVRALDGGMDNGWFYLSMELIRGANLQQLIMQKHLSVAACCELIRQVAVGLMAVHSAGLVHRDIKPANIMLTAEGIVKLVDFGLALRPEDPSELTGSHFAVGTVRYISPEQCRGRKEVDQRSDIYSLGCTLMTLLQADHFWSDPDESPRDDRIPHALQKVVRRMVDSCPSKRIQTAGEVVACLTPIIEGAQPPVNLTRLPPRVATNGNAGPDSLMQSWSRSIRPFRSPSGYFLVILMLSAIAATTVILHRMRNPRSTTNNSPRNMSALPADEPSLTSTAEQYLERTGPPPLSETQAAAWLIHAGAHLTVNVRTGDRWTGLTTDDISRFIDHECMVHELELAGASFGDEHLKVVCGLHHLQGLRCRDFSVTDRNLAEFRDEWKLRWLYLPGGQISDNGVAFLFRYRSTLENLDLSGAAISDQSLRLLAEFPKLRELRIGGSGVSELGISLLSNYAALVALDLSGLSLPPETGSILSDCENLRRVNLSNSNLTGQILQSLPGTQLTELNISGTEVTTEAAKVFAAKYPDCRLIW
ncbi:MAG: protein kinase [Planctomycetaceae bacterium]